MARDAKEWAAIEMQLADFITRNCQRVMIIAKCITEIKKEISAVLELILQCNIPQRVTSFLVVWVGICLDGEPKRGAGNTLSMKRVFRPEDERRISRLFITRTIVVAFVGLQVIEDHLHRLSDYRSSSCRGVWVRAWRDAVLKVHLYLLVKQCAYSNRSGGRPAQNF